MRLIVKAARQCHLRQPSASGFSDETAGTLEAHYSRRNFWRDTDGTAETLAEVAAAVTDVIRQHVDRHRAVRAQESVPRP